MSASLLSGGCLCGRVRFEVTEPLVRAGYCHCTRCQRRTGTAASVQARVPSGAFRLLAGDDALGRFEPGDGGFHKVFCTGCGAALWSEAPDDPDVRSVRLGAIDGDPGLRPTFRQFTAYAAPWEPIPDDGLERFPEGRP